MSTSTDVNQQLLQCLKDVVEVQAWHYLGEADLLKEQKLRRLYGDTEGEDVVLIYDIEEDSFHAMDAVCSHEGGPLDLGDIEDIGGERCIVCPWHSYEFRLNDGCSDSTGLQQDIYPLMELDGKLFIRTGELELTLEPKSSPSLESCGSEPDLAANSLLESNHSQNTLTYAAYQILTASDPLEKIRLSQLFGSEWNSGDITDLGDYPPPDQPTRSPDQYNVVEPGKERKNRKGGSLISRITILHSMANIELWAIDLSWDIISRFVPHFRLNDEPLPKEFTDDFVRVALEETKHFNLLKTRLGEMGSHFGSLPVHNGLWESAETTNHSILARLAVVHMVHEARGLDVQPTQITKFERQKDMDSLSILNTVYTEEITHVAVGLKWFNFICENSQPKLDPVQTFHEIVKKNFKGFLKPPFNAEARTKAGMTPEWYEPLTRPKNPISIFTQPKPAAGETGMLLQDEAFTQEAVIGGIQSTALNLSALSGECTLSSGYLDDHKPTEVTNLKPTCTTCYLSYID